jgi:hypothetical protein
VNGSRIIARRGFDDKVPVLRTRPPTALLKRPSSNSVIPEREAAASAAASFGATPGEQRFTRPDRPHLPRVTDGACRLHAVTLAIAEFHGDGAARRLKVRGWPHPPIEVAGLAERVLDGGDHRLGV